MAKAQSMPVIVEEVARERHERSIWDDQRRWLKALLPSNNPPPCCSRMKRLQKAKEKYAR